jgi:hypothetical protein
MRVEVDLGASRPAVSLAEPGDCGRFHVAVHAADDGAGDDASRRATRHQALDAALRAHDVGSVVGDDHAAITVAAVRRLAVGAVDAGWDEDFGSMLAYAGSKGWMSEDGRTIRAHIEWQ